MQQSNRRIARNTLFIYIRMATAVATGLYVSRIALGILGVSDYGLFAVVGGVLAMFTFISNSLATATTRFLNIEMGKPDGDVNASFNINLLLHIGMAAVILVLAESVGLWYIYNHLNVEPGKLGDAVFIYQASILTACIGIVNTPYASLFNANECFKFTAALDIANCFVRLGCVALLYLAPSDGLPISIGHCQTHISLLRLYSIIFVLTTVNTFVVYHFVAWRRWRDTIRLRFVRGWQRYREVLVFNNWNMLATMSYMACNSGTDLLFNAFFGTATNGAFAISRMVKQTIANFTGNFDSASAPQIVQAYAAADRDRYTYLCNKIGRINILAFELLCFPLLVELDFVLRLWLGKVPDGAYTMTYLCIIQGGIALTCGGIYNLINATGRIKWFKINLSIFFLVCIPIGYVMFSAGWPAYTLIVTFIIADIAQRGIQLWLMHRIIGFDSWDYVRQAYVRPAVIAAVMAALLYARTLLDIATPFQRCLSIALTAVVTSMLIWTIGMTRGERQKVKSTILRQKAKK